MKKILILVFVLVLLLSSCSNASKDPIETKTQPQDTETVAPSDSFYENYSATPIPLSLKANSIEDLVSEIKAIKDGKHTESGVGVSSLNELIVPDVEIEGYKFWLFTAGTNYFQYVYIPTSSKMEKNMRVDFDNHIVIYIARPEYVSNKENPLQGIVNQMGVPINEEGYINLGNDRNIAFAYEQTWATVRYPTALTYDEAKQYCKLKTIKID